MSQPQQFDVTIDTSFRSNLREALHHPAAWRGAPANHDKLHQSCVAKTGDELDSSLVEATFLLIWPVNFSGKCCIFNVQFAIVDGHFLVCFNFNRYFRTVICFGEWLRIKVSLNSCKHSMLCGCMYVCINQIGPIKSGVLFNLSMKSGISECTVGLRAPSSSPMV